VIETTETNVERRPDPANPGRRLTTDDVFEDLRASHAAKEKAELLLSNLVKLKADIAAIEARYVLNDDFSRMCDDAISKMTAMKTALEKAIQNKIGDLEVFEKNISNVEARAKLDLIPPETHARQKRPSRRKARPATKERPAGGVPPDPLESSLDGIGDGIIWLGERILKVFRPRKNHQRTPKRKQTRG
jgi:hypothetical protein